MGTDHTDLAGVLVYDSEQSCNIKLEKQSQGQ